MIRRLWIVLWIAVLTLAAGCGRLETFFGGSLPDGGVTVQAAATFVAPNRTADGTLSILVLSAAELPAEAAGLRRLHMSVSVTNQSSGAVMVTAESLRIRDQERNLYPALVPETPGLPYLIGTSIPPAASVVGILQVDLPQTTAISDLTLMWCLETTCQSPLEVPLALYGNN